MRIGLLKPDDIAAVEAIAGLDSTDLDVVSELEKSWARIWVARDAESGRAVGFLHAWLVADEIHIINVATHPAQRRTGVATALLGRLVRFARGRRARMLLLEVRRSNHAAINLYRSQGFWAIGVRLGYYATEREDAIEMILALDPETGHIRPGRDEIRLAET